MPDHDDANQSDQNNEPDHIRDLRAKAKEADELRTRLAKVERDHAFSQALGSDAEQPGVAKYFMPAYDGELTKEAIRAAALEAGFIRANQNQGQQQDPDLAAHQRMADASNGAGGGSSPNWQDALSEADRIPDRAEREAAILAVVEKNGGVTSRNMQ